MASTSTRSCPPSSCDGKRKAEAREEPSRLQTPPGQADHAHLALDGKTLRATTGQAQPVHQLSCYEVATGIVLWHCDVQAKENEESSTQAMVDAALDQRASLHLRCHAHPTCAV